MNSKSYLYFTTLVADFDWPKETNVLFKNVSLQYDDHCKNALDKVSFQINEKEKIGIVGRTGAGKSSLMSAILRLHEVTGDIMIGNVNIKAMKLCTLRKNISVIPQDPVLFSGTIRYNLDPFNEHSDDDIWKVLGEVIRFIITIGLLHDFRLLLDYLLFLAFILHRIHLCNVFAVCKY